MHQINYDAHINYVSWVTGGKRLSCLCRIYVVNTMFEVKFSHCDDFFYSVTHHINILDVPGTTALYMYQWYCFNTT